MKRNSGILVALFAAGAVAAFPVGTGNDGFETGSADQATGWGTNQATPSGILELRHAPTPFAGDRFLAITTRAGQLHQLYPERQIEVAPGDRITLSVMVRGRGTFRLGLYEYAAGFRMTGSLQTEPLTPESADAWNRVEQQWTVNDAAIANVAPVLIVEGDSEVHFDVFALDIAAPEEKSIPRFVPGSNRDPAPAPEAGAQPYEMTGRAEVRKPLATFEDGETWVIENRDSDAALYRTTDQRLFRPYTGKVVYRAAGLDPVFTVRPAQPIPIPEPWDTVECWNWGNVWCWVGGIPRLNSSVLVTGADGVEYEIPFEVMFYEYWNLQRRRVHRDIPRPAAFTGLRFTGGTNRKPQTIYLDSVSFYQHEEEPLAFAPLPTDRPFPTTPDTILPDNRTAEFTNRATPTPDGGCDFEYRDGADTLIYRVRPKGDRCDVTAEWDGKSMTLFDGVRIILADGQPAQLRLIRNECRDGTLQLDWELLRDGRAVTTLTQTLQIRQKSLLVDWHENAAEGQIQELAIGRIGNLQTPRLIEVPYISYGWEQTAPRVLLDDGVFVFAHFDWFRSDAGELFAVADADGNSAAINGGARYLPKTDGKRNPVRERLFLTVSDDFAEVLPNIPNPPSPLRELQGDRLWRIRPGVDYAGEIADARRLRRLGMDKVTIRYHEGTWRDGGESYTFRTEAAPGKGGDAALRQMIAEVQSLGWLAGLYTNYTDLAPVNPWWDADHATQDSNGDWVTGWARCYNPKPRWIVGMEAELAPEIHAKFGNRHVYCDVHTAVAPWIRTDYDARVPDAGKFRAVFECFGTMLLNERKAYDGPVYSEGGVHWLYAGLDDGNYAQLFVARPMEMPLLPDFDLLKLHPLSMDAGMGSPAMFYRSQAPNLDQYIATSLAYGHIGCLEGSEAELLRLYYLFQPLQPHYVMVPVADIAWADDDGVWHATGAALTDGAIHRRGRLRVTYRNGFTLYVNGGSADWTPGPGLPALPQWGWLARQDGVTLGARQRLDGRIVEYTRGDASLYWNAPDGYAVLGDIGGDGGAALKFETDARYLIPVGDFRNFEFTPEAAGLTPEAELTVAALDDNDAVLKSFRPERHDGRIRIPAVAGAMRYRISVSPQTPQ